MAQSEARFVRWQSLTIMYLSYTVNLILGFDIAALGFAFSLVKDKDFVPSCWSRCFLDLSIPLLLLSAGVGIWCVINRLRDFRKTAAIARHGSTWTPEKLILKQNETEKLGERTWTLFYWQIGIFGFGLSALVVALIIAYHAKLFSN